MIIGGRRGPGWRVLDAHPGQARQVRHWIAAAVAGHGCPIDAGDAALAVGELFANAVRHGPPGGRVVVGYCLWQRGARLAVADGGGTGTPSLRPRTALAEGGQGLYVVDALAARWDSFRLTGALVVWCDLGQPLRAPAADAWAWLRQVLSACDLSPALRPAADAGPRVLAAAAAR